MKFFLNILKTVHKNRQRTTNIAALEKDSQATLASTDSDSISSSQEKGKETARYYLEALRCRFDHHCEHQQADWADFWIEEEKHFQASQRVLVMNSGMKYYIRSREDRILNFMWAFCRDAPTSSPHLESRFHRFVDREHKVLEMVCESYISLNQRRSISVK